MTLAWSQRPANLPRRDITLRVGDLTVSPSLGLGTWAGFGGTPQDATMMGDLVVLSGELKRVLAEFSRQGIEEPVIYYIHFWADGRPGGRVARTSDCCRRGT